MSNMHYWRYRHILKHIEELEEDFTGKLPTQEHNARAWLIAMMIELLSSVGYEIDEENADVTLTTIKSREASS